MGPAVGVGGRLPRGLYHGGTDSRPGLAGLPGTVPGVQIFSLAMNIPKLSFGSDQNFISIFKKQILNVN
jgi:hypothetical protein